MSSTRGVSWGGFGGRGPPGSLKGRQKKKKKERERRERKEKKRKEREKEMKGQKRKKIERQINITRGAPFRGGLKVGAGGAPPPFFSEVGHLTLCGRLRENNAPNRADAD